MPADYNPKALYLKHINGHNYDLKPAKTGDAGMDLPVRVQGVKVEPDITHEIHGETVSIYIYEDHFFIPALGKAEVPCGFHVKIPDGHWGNIKARSSTGWKKSLNVFEGVIDSGYVGPMYVLVHNPTDKPVRVDDGSRLAQLVIIPAKHAEEVVVVDRMPETHRGESGFGSSGQ